MHVLHFIHINVSEIGIEIQKKEKPCALHIAFKQPLQTARCEQKRLLFFFSLKSDRALESIPFSLFYR